MRRIAAIIVRSFLQGLIILSPIAITAYLIYAVFDQVDSLLVIWVPRGLGFLIIITAITFIGYLGTRFIVGRVIVDGFDYVLEQIPGVKYLYTSIKDILESFVGDKKRFNKAVWVRTGGNPEAWRVGFLTREDMSYLDMPDKVAVYLPYAYAISGYVIIIGREHIREMDKMNAAEAMKFAVSGGVASVDEEKSGKTIGKT